MLDHSLSLRLFTLVIHMRVLRLNISERRPGWKVSHQRIRNNGKFPCVQVCACGYQSLLFSKLIWLRRRKGKKEKIECVMCYFADRLSFFEIRGDISRENLLAFLCFCYLTRDSFMKLCPNRERLCSFFIPEAEISLFGFLGFGTHLTLLWSSLFRIFNTGLHLQQCYHILKEYSYCNL